MPKVKAGIWPAAALCWLIFALPVRAAFEMDCGGPRAASLGGAGVALSGDGWAGLRNPALAAESRTVIGLDWSQQFGLPELAREELLAVTRWRRQAVGVVAGTFGSALYRESEFGILWAKSLRPDLHIGADLRMRGLNIENYPSSHAFTLTIGASGEPLPNVTIAAVWRNLNEPRLSGYCDRIAGSLTVGAAARLQPGGIVAVDIVQEPHFPAELRVGGELRVLPGLALRVGGRAEPVRPSAGLQVDAGRWSFVYAGDLHPDLGVSHQVGFEIRLAK